MAPRSSVEHSHLQKHLTVVLDVQGANPRMVKILKAFESVEPAMMDSLHEDQ
jgi:hypothetical protein